MTFLDILKERTATELRNLDQLIRGVYSDRLYGRERYWFNRMRRRTHDREARKLIHAYMEGVRNGDLQVTRDKNSPFGFFVEKAWWNA